MEEEWPGIGRKQLLHAAADVAAVIVGDDGGVVPAELLEGVVGQVSGFDAAALVVADFVVKLCGDLGQDTGRMSKIVCLSLLRDIDDENIVH